MSNRMDEYAVNMSELAPAFIDITKVELSTDGGTTWTEISENGTVYVKEGTVPQYRVTVKNTGDVASDITYVGLYDYGEGGTETPDLEAYNSNYDFQLDPGAETTVTLDYGMCSPQPTFCPVERGHVYKIISAHATNVGDDTFTFTIAEPAFMDISILSISPEPPIPQGNSASISVKVTNTGDTLGALWLRKRRKDYGGDWSEWETIKLGLGIPAGDECVATIEFNMPNRRVDFEFESAQNSSYSPRDDLEAVTIYEALEGAFKDGSLQICDSSKCEVGIPRGGTVEFMPTSKTPTITVKNTGGVAQKLTITLYDITDGEPGTVVSGYPVETPDPVDPGAEVTLELPAFSYPGGTRHYKLKVEP